ncbi:DNA glycosylase [uncultured Clostridium sp.]|uniref:DNA-3-methyladenine glycosylase family protein n=1 Tax=uncultured Clostridium sp. TaxID=59620 RepID=UPI0026385280|nr:DNA glycosylase [uncultured Clostridium sp.]
MDYKNIEYIDNEVILEGVKNFNIKQILECGQCFRWDKISEMNYIIVAFGRVLEIKQEEDKVIFSNTNKIDFEKIWLEYFDLGRDYDDIKEKLDIDETLKKSMEFGYGIRLLNQEAYEIVLSFIISARNSIPMIKKTILNISEKWGNEIDYKGKKYYTFPTSEMLKGVTEEELKAIGGSFRSKYIVDTVGKVNGDIANPSGEFNLERIIKLNDDECHKALQEFKGIGAKVADCIMLFGMGKHSAFPVDRWVERIMNYFYKLDEKSLPKIRVIGRDKFGELAGFAQQYLFYYAITNNIKIK